MSGDHAKLADAITELLALLKPDHAKYVEYLLKRASALQQQPAKAQVAADAWKTLLEHPWAEEHRLLATRRLYEFELASEKAELQAETEKNFQARVKKTPPVEHEQLRQTIERELRTAMLARTEVDRYLQRLMELCSTSEFHVKAIQRLQVPLYIALHWLFTSPRLASPSQQRPPLGLRFEPPSVTLVRVQLRASRRSSP